MNVGLGGTGPPLDGQSGPLKRVPPEPSRATGRAGPATSTAHREPEPQILMGREPAALRIRNLENGP